MKYIKLFDKLSDFESVKDNLDRPNVSLIQETNSVTYFPAAAIDYFKEYFTIEALEDGLTAKLSINTCEYRVDNGDWTTLVSDTDTIVINTGQTLSFKGNLTPMTTRGIGAFTISKKCNVKGNIMSLLYGDDFIDKIDLTGKKWAFSNLFYNCTNIVDASKLILPATTLDYYCYYSMFSGCKNLTAAPELPATTLDYYCYYSMFYECTSLTTAPELPATTLAKYCYSTMFYGCTNLTTAPELPATTLVDYCYSTMFYGCSKLNYIKALFTNSSFTINTSRLYTDNWVNGVSSTGTFVKSKNATWNLIGVNGIPGGWTVETV